MDKDSVNPGDNHWNWYQPIPGAPRDILTTFYWSEGVTIDNPMRTKSIGAKCFRTPPKRFESRWESLVRRTTVDLRTSEIIEDIECSQGPEQYERERNLAMDS